MQLLNPRIVFDFFKNILTKIVKNVVGSSVHSGFVKLNLKFNFWHLKLISFQLEESFEDDDHPPEAAADNHHEDPETEENGNEQPEEENGDKVGQRIFFLIDMYSISVRLQIYDYGLSLRYPGLTQCPTKQSWELSWTLIRTILTMRQ